MDAYYASPLKKNKKSDEDKSKFEAELQQKTLSQLMELSYNGGLTGYIPLVAFNRIPSILRDASLLTDVHQKHFFTHSDPFFAAGALLRSCSFVSTNFHLSHLMELFLKEIHSNPTISLLRRIPRLLIGFHVCLSTYDSLPEQWELDESKVEEAAKEEPSNSVTTAKEETEAEDDSATDEDAKSFDYRGMDMDKMEVNLLEWRQFPLHWQLLYSLGQNHWQNEEIIDRIRTFLDRLLYSIRWNGEKMFHWFVSCLIASMQTHESDHKRCECVDCLRMINIFSNLHNSTSENQFPVESWTVVSLSASLTSSSIVGYWQKEVYLRIIPFLYVFPDWKHSIEIMYEEGNIDMASFMDNLFLDKLFISLSNRPYLMRDIVLSLLDGRDISPNDTPMYEQAAFSIVLFSISQLGSAKDDYIVCLCQIKERLPYSLSEFFRRIRDTLSKQDHSSRSDSTEDGSIPPCLFDKFLDEMESLTQHRSLSLEKVDSASYQDLCSNLITMAQHEDIVDNDLFTEKDPYFSAGKLLNKWNPNIETVGFFMDSLKSSGKVKVYQRVPRIFIGMLVDMDLWCEFKEEWAAFTSLPMSDVPRMERKVDEEAEKKAKIMLSRLISLCEVRLSGLSSLFTTSLMVAQLQENVEPVHWCFKHGGTECYQCRGLTETFCILKYHYAYYGCPPFPTHYYESPQRVFNTIFDANVGATINGYSSFYSIFDDLYEDGRIHMGKLMYTLWSHVDMYALLCSKPTTLLKVFALDCILRTDTFETGLGEEFIVYSLECSILIAKNPDKFIWRGKSQAPSLDEVFSQYSSVIRDIHEFLEPPKKEIFLRRLLSIQERYDELGEECRQGRIEEQLRLGEVWEDDIPSPSEIEEKQNLMEAFDFIKREVASITATKSSIQ